MSELEQCCELVRQRSLATGHADDVVELMREVLWQLDEVRRERDMLRKAIEDAHRILAGGTGLDHDTYQTRCDAALDVVWKAIKPEDG